FSARAIVFSWQRRCAATPRSTRVSSSRAAHDPLSEQLGENAAAVGPEYQHHTHQRASGHHPRGHRQGEFFGELGFAPRDYQRNESAEKEKEPIVPVKSPGETKRRRRGKIILIPREQNRGEREHRAAGTAGKYQPQLEGLERGETLAERNRN